MKQLTALDAAFLQLESDAMPMHVGAVCVYALPSGMKGRFVTRLRAHMAERLPLAPVLQRRVWWMPLNLANPMWAEAEPDLSWHVVDHKLPATARQGDGLAAVSALAGELHAQTLPRDRPLWRMHVIEGLAPLPDGRRRVAVYTQFHHAAVDGQAAVALAQVLLDLSPDVQRAPAAAGRRRLKQMEMGAVQMLRGAIAQEIEQLGRLVRALPGTAQALKQAAGTALSLRQAGKGTKSAGDESAEASPLAWLQSLGQGLGEVRQLISAPRTPFNVNVQPGRQFAGLSLPMATLKAVARARGATLNDVVLYLCSTALRRYLAAHGGVPRKSLVAAVPISLREKGDTTANNQASMSLVSLGTHLADAQRRLGHIQAASTAMKATVGSMRSVLPTDAPSIGLPWLMQAVAGLYGRARVAERMPAVANVVISNVPGPPVALYLAGAQMLGNYPTSIVAHGLALNITVQSWGQQMDFGLVADAHAVPDLPALAQAIQAAFDDLPLLLPTEAPPAELPGLPELARAGQRLLGDAQRQLLGAVGGAVGQAVTSAVTGVVKGAMNKAIQDALGGPGRATKPAARKPVTKPVTKTVTKTVAKKVTSAAAPAKLVKPTPVTRASAPRTAATAAKTARPAPPTGRQRRT